MSKSCLLASLAAILAASGTSVSAAMADTIINTLPSAGSDIVGGPVDTNTTFSATTVGNLRCEHVRDPLGIDVRKPRLSWQLNSTRRGDLQLAYQVLVASSSTLLAQDQGDLWNSGQVVSDQQMLVEYAGQPLTSGQACFWKVRSWDGSGNRSAWSSPAMWSMGLFDPSDWGGKWIGMATDTTITPAAPSPMLRKTFTVSKTVARATAYICGLGYYELMLNGAKVGDHVLDPTWTRYDRQADYVTYDVTTNLLQGQNAVGVQLANGFYNQWAKDSWNSFMAFWRALPQMIMRLDIQYTDGSHDLVVSDPTWKTSTGPLVLEETRLGEVYDARLEKSGWATASYDDSAWANAILREGVAGSLIAPNAEPIRVKSTIAPVQIYPVVRKTGVYTFDFGQNVAGWGKLSVTGPAGTSVRMIFGEKTNSDGSVYQGNINHLISHQEYFQTDTYILKGGGTEVWEPRFTYHGFRYVQVEGLPEVPTTKTLVARVLHTDLESAGSFLCSNDLLNRIETCTFWSYLGNFVGIPTDCPQREKNGWAGDAQLACEIGLTHFQSAAAYTRWMKEFKAAQMANGGLYAVVPTADWGANMGPPWESAYLLISWCVYQHFGDVGILKNNYAGMKAYVDYLTSVASGNIIASGLGDWLPASTSTPSGVTSTMYYYDDALIVARTAALMGQTSESLQYSNLAARIKTSFNKEFYNSSNKQYSGGTLTAQSCALYEGLVEKDQISGAADALAARVQQGENTVDTGIIGSKYLLRALCDNGHSDLAWALAVQTNHPSWGYMIENGATTLWETWDGSGAGTSFNHVMFGDISAWFIEYVGGIRPGTPGYKTVIIKPEVMNSLTWANATHNSPYGMISSAWQVNGQTVNLKVTIPPGSTAWVYLPTLGKALADLVIQETGVTIWQNGGATTNVSGVAFDHFEGKFPQSYLVWSVKSGSYRFSWNATPVLGGLGATPGDQHVKLRWNSVAGATGYNVKRSQTPGGPYTVVAGGITNVTFTDTALNNHTSYYYVISAVNGGGEGVSSAELTATPELVLNLGFELPMINNCRYNPSGAYWTFMHSSGDGSGLIANGSDFSNPTVPEGTQAAFIQSHGNISQTLAGFAPGTKYTITFAAAQRSGGNQHGGESWDVKVDDTVVGSFNPGPSATSYVDYTVTFVASSAAHKLSFVGTDLTTGDNTVFIDNVRIVPALRPALSH